MQTALDRYLAAMHDNNLYPSTGNLRYYTRCLFDGVPLRGSCFLDVGGGSGLFTFYASTAGAARAVCLEPELAGSTTNVANAFSRIRDSLDLPNAELIAKPLDSFDAPANTFSVVLMHASINHIDEWATINLRKDPQAVVIYEKIARKLYNLMEPGGRLIVTDTAPVNVFSLLGLRNPFQPTIEWHKHQPPKVWAALFAKVGFRTRRIQWITFNSLRAPGRLLFGNRLVAFLSTSAFCLEMERL